MFSLPINQKLTEEQFHIFYEFCAKYRPFIYDLYFTCRMPPFIQDAMGDIITNPQDANDIILTALHIQNTLQIPISATFNNIHVPPTQKNLDLFANNFQQLYDAGIKVVTIPHTHWVATKQIQKKFPELFIKNTILRNVSRANEIAKLAEAGFHYVNLDRDLMRNRDELIRCKKAADKFNVKLSLLANEGCLGNCPMMDEHFSFNNFRTGPSYFHDPISRTSCAKWDITDPSSSLKTANIPPWKDDWDELLNYVDVFKMHGRESIDQLFNSMSIIENYANQKEILYDEFNAYLEDNDLEDRPINVWRKTIKNCKFDCWDCNLCDKLYEKRNTIKPHEFLTTVVNELVDSVNYNNDIEVPGLTSKRVQNLLYGLSEHVNNYLEIGSAMGATAVAIKNDLEIHCVDNWKNDVQPDNDSFILPVNTKTEFLNNTKHIKNLHVHDCDMFDVDLNIIKNIELFFYDGPHDFEITSKVVEFYSQCFAKTCIMIFDDANWVNVVKGAEDGIAKSKLNVIYNRLLLNDQEDKTQWWNGLYIVVVEKNDKI